MLGPPYPTSLNAILYDPYGFRREVRGGVSTAVWRGLLCEYWNTNYLYQGNFFDNIMTTKYNNKKYNKNTKTDATTER